MGKWKENKSPFDFPEQFHQVLKAIPGSYMISPLLGKDDLTEKRKIINRWNYFKYSVRNYPSLSLAQHLERKTFRVKVESFIGDRIYVTVIVQEKSSSLEDLRKAVKL